MRILKVSAAPGGGIKLRKTEVGAGRGGSPGSPHARACAYAHMKANRKTCPLPPLPPPLVSCKMRVNAQITNAIKALRSEHSPWDSGAAIGVCNRTEVPMASKHLNPHDGSATDQGYPSAPNARLCSRAYSCGLASFSPTRTRLWS